MGLPPPPAGAGNFRSHDPLCPSYLQTLAIRYCLLDTDTAFASAIGYRSDNFVVGLTNVHPLVTTPTLFNYTLCAQYQGTETVSATVSVQCVNVQSVPFKFVIVQFPVTRRAVVICEVQVFAISK